MHPMREVMEMELPFARAVLRAYNEQERRGQTFQVELAKAVWGGKG